MAKDEQNCLYKSQDKWLNGVIGGICEHYDWDKNLGRILVIIAMIAGLCGVVIITYIALMFFMTDPENDNEQQNNDDQNDEHYCETDEYDDGKV
ncbi:hypothetical protein PBI_SCTP2_42 [Salicola phage SCTP-2]|nr:hypothetical protein PBI_SCTP2_42 [Salicola phage SCTP-2]